MLGNAHFYNRTIRKVVVAFGTVFNDIHLVRYTKDGLTAKEMIKVPLNWGAKEKYLTRLTTDPTLTKSIATTVPRISFEMTGMSYDSSRKLPTTMRNFSTNNSATTIKSKYVTIPYNFDFSMSVYVRNTEDGTQILEQILPFFTPDFSVTVDFIDAMDQKYDMPIILNSVSNEVDYEGDMMSTRLIIWNLEFTAKGYIWPPVKTGKVINSANTNFFIEPNSTIEQQVYVDFANGVGRFSDSESIRVADRDVFGKVVYFSNANNGILIVQSLNDYLQVGDIVRGDFTGATFTIKTADKTPLLLTKITTRPNPANAQPDDEFGFSETITDGPST